MNDRQINRLTGMHDAIGAAYRRVGEASSALQKRLMASGYEQVDTPVLEETELFVRKSGGELSGRLYTFTDPGRHNVSLRPEFTSSVIRLFIEHQDALSLPVRWQYSGPVFRYEPASEGVYRQFNQVGAELIGASGVDADAEIVNMAASGLSEIGIQSFQLRVGHLGLLHQLLSGYRLSEPARLYIIGCIHEIKSGGATVEELQRRAEEVGLVRTESSLGPVPLPDIEDADSTDSFIESYLRASVPEPIGMRTTEQIVARLMEKLRNANDPAEFRRALELIAEISALVGEPSAVMERGRAVAANHGVGAAPFDELGKLFGRLDDASIRADVTLDLGHARGIAYYTGVIFEMMDGPLSLGGGGRYDGLVAALGGGNVPAMGFAYNLDHVLNALAATKA